MKKKFTLIFFLITVLCSYSQNTTAIIEYEGNLDMGNLQKRLDTIPKKFHTLIRGQHESIKPVYFQMQVNNNESTFLQEKTLKVEGQRSNVAVIDGQRGKFYINTKTKETLREKDVMGEQYLISHSLDSIKWVFTKDTKKIGNYTCYKAYTKLKKYVISGETEEELIAWYCPEISIYHGPVGMANLPGLIIELQRGNFNYRMIKIEFNPKKVLIKKPNSGKLISQIDFYEIENNVTQSIRNLGQKK